MKFAFADFELDVDRNELRRAGKLIKADATAVRLLVVLMTKAPNLVSKEELVEIVWDGRAIADNVLTVTIARLRKLLNQRFQEREFIKTSYGRGYRFTHPFEKRGASLVAPNGLSGLADSSLCIVGRERQLATLQRALSRARTGRGRLCTLMGEPGIGKTYLVEALDRGLTDGQVQVAWGFCREAGDTPPLGPWLRLIREIKATAERLAWPLVEHRVVGELEQMMRVLDMRDLAGAQLPDVIHHMSVKGPQRHRLFEAIASFLAVAANHAPWLLVFEDLHRVDDASLELLHHLLDEVMRMRILVVATLRPAEAQSTTLGPARLSQVLGHRNCERIVLERLSEGDVATYVDAQLGHVDGEIGRAIYAKSEGNPFFMAELTRQQMAMGRVDPDALTLPSASLDLVRQQIARLDATTREVLSAAAVIGRSFELPLLRVATELDASVLMASVDEAIAAEVIVAASDTKTGFAFGHELLRSVLYDALSPSERRAWHFRIAEALETRSEKGEAAPPSELAHHFHAALPETDLQKAVRFCRKAAACAALASANAEVVRYTRHALEALEMLDRPSVRLRMHLLFVVSMFTRGYSMPEFMRATNELLIIAGEQDNARMLVSAGTLLNLHPGMKPVPGAPSVMRRALELLPPERRSLRASALAGLAVSAPICFTEQSYMLIAEAVAVAEDSGAPVPRYVALLGELYLQGGPRGETRAAALVDELERLAQQHLCVMPELPIDLAFHRMVTALQRGDLASMSAAIERAAARSREVQHRVLLWHAARYRLLARINVEGAGESWAELAALHHEAERGALFGTAPFCAFDRVVLRGERPSESMRAALAYDPSEPPSIWSLKLRALATAGLHDEARGALRAIDAPSGLTSLPCDTHYLGTLGHVAYAALRLGELAYAQAVHSLLEPYADYYAAHVSLYVEGAVPHLLGMLSHALGRTSQAMAELERGIAMNDRAGFATRAAEGRLLLARCLVARGGAADFRRAKALRREAQTVAERLGMSRLLEDGATQALGAPA